MPDTLNRNMGGRLSAHPISSPSYFSKKTISLPNRGGIEPTDTKEWSAWRDTEEGDKPTKRRLNNDYIYIIYIRDHLTISRIENKS